MFGHRLAKWAAHKRLGSECEDPRQARAATRKLGARIRAVAHKHAEECGSVRTVSVHPAKFCKVTAALGCLERADVVGEEFDQVVLAR
jgi:hypothetical protein